jgi:hypothetical protein
VPDLELIVNKIPGNLSTINSRSGTFLTVPYYLYGPNREKLPDVVQESVT